MPHDRLIRPGKRALADWSAAVRCEDQVIAAGVHRGARGGWRQAGRTSEDRPAPSSLESAHAARSRSWVSSVSRGVEYDEFVRDRLPSLLRYAAVLSGDADLAADLV